MSVGIFEILIVACISLFVVVLPIALIVFLVMGLKKKSNNG